MNSEHEEEALFDLLPDAVVHLIFNRVHDAKSLCRSMSVCKRFKSIIPQIDTVFLSIPPLNPIPINNNDSKQTSDRNSKSSSCGLQKNLLKSFINKVMVKPLQFLLQIVISKSSNCSHSEADGDDHSFHSLHEIIKNFKEIQRLHIELPSHAGIIGSSNDSLLKWKAEFGSKLESCVVLGATSFHERIKHESEQLDSFLTDEELKLRVVWTISCLIAASARHYSLQQLLSEQRMLQDFVVVDAGKQGRLCMKKEQIEELRNFSMDSETSQSIERTRVPSLKMKLWYVPELELPASGCVLKGATLVVIRPVDGPNAVQSDSDLVAKACGGEEEDEVFGEAVRKLIKRRKTYTLEMNSF